MGRSERRNNTRESGRQRRGAAQETSAPEASGTLLPIGAESKSIARAEEHSTGVEPVQIAPASSKVPILEQLLGNIATPVRSNQPPQVQRNSVPYSPPVHAPTLIVSASATPPPPSRPASGDQVPQAQWEAPQTAIPALPEPGFTSYREKLRAGGRGAFQRNIDAGLIPKAMKQEAVAGQMQQAPAQGYLPQQAHVQNGTGMQYVSSGDGQHMWGSTEYGNLWSMPVDQSHNMSSQCQYVEQMSHLEQQMIPQSLEQMLAPQPQMSQQMTVPMMPQMTAHQPNMQDCMQMMPMAQDVQSLQMSQCSPVGLPQIGECTPTDINRCLAIVMPQAAQFPCDRDSMVAQLKAAA